MTAVVAPASASSPEASTRECPGQQLTCNQLVALGLTYPYPRQPSSYLFVNGVAYSYVALGHRRLMDASVRAGNTTVAAKALLDQLGLGGAAEETRTPVIAYGSNANVEALTRKFVTSNFAGQAVIPVVKATLRGFDVVWSPHFAFNGAMPATIVASPGTRVTVWITWLDSAELAEMNVSEGVGALYSYGYLRHAALRAAGPMPTRVGIYVDCFGALSIDRSTLAVKGIAARGRHVRALDSAGAMHRITAAIGWHASVYELILDNVRSASASAEHTRELATHSVHLPLPGYQTIDRCTFP